MSKRNALFRRVIESRNQKQKMGIKQKLAPRDAAAYGRQLKISHVKHALQQCLQLSKHTNLG